MTEPLSAATVLPVGSTGHHASGWFGMWCLVVTEGALFVYLLFSYFYCASQQAGAWPPGGPPKLDLALPNTAILLASSAAVWWGERNVRRNRRGAGAIGLLVGLVLGCIFAAVQLREWHGKPFGFGPDLYGTLFYTVTGFHLAHVVAGLFVLAALALWTGLGKFDARRHVPVSIGAVYWHFVDAVWIVVFTSLYLLPYARAQ
jgi:heme/copper-type cytochrome/quinol oxidase subunit 3